MAIDWRPYRLTLMLINVALCAYVFLITWRIARRFGWRGLVIVGFGAAIIGPPRLLVHVEISGVGLLCTWVCARDCDLRRLRHPDNGRSRCDLVGGWSCSTIRWLARLGQPPRSHLELDPGTAQVAVEPASRTSVRGSRSTLSPVLFGCLFWVKGIVKGPHVENGSNPQYCESRSNPCPQYISVTHSHWQKTRPGNC